MNEEKTTKKRKITKKKVIKKLEVLKYYGTGRRKTSVARVFVKAGNGKVIINGRSLEEYTCGRNFLMSLAEKPMVVTETENKYDVVANVIGGGIPSQLGAYSLGLARALASINLDFRQKLRKLNLLTRDSRMKERKKYGHKRARKSFQYSKR